MEREIPAEFDVKRPCDPPEPGKVGYTRVGRQLDRILKRKAKLSYETNSVLVHVALMCCVLSITRTEIYAFETHSLAQRKKGF